MSRASLFWLAVTILALLTAVWPALAQGQQDEPLRPNETSPATGHAQVIAHGVSPMPGQEIGWQVAVARALLPNRAEPDAPQPGFVLADDGALAVTDIDGNVLDRLAPGEATWIPSRRSLAVVSLERDPVDFVAISLLPASELPASTQDRRMTGETPFTAPPGTTFDLDLIRDVLARDEETTIAAGSAPSLLLVTGGTVFLTTADGAVSELDAGSVTQSAGDLVVSGGSRGPAAFVVARIGPEVPAQLPLRQEESSNTPLATPVTAAETTATVQIEAFVCPVAYPGTDFAADCTTPAEDIAFSIESNGTTLHSALTDARGEVSFRDVPPGDYTLLAGVPGDFASSRVTCRDSAGAEVGQETEFNLARVSLAAAADVDCDWYIVPDNARGEDTGTGLTVLIRACPPGMTTTSLVATECIPAPPGTSLSLFAGDQLIGAATATDDRWTWDGLESQTYELVLNELPAGFLRSSLDDQLCCDDRGGFPITIAPDSSSLEMTLYLFQPAGVEADAIDTDGDRLTDARESELGTDPTQADSDGDALSDGDEVDVYGTDPLRPDTDGDDLTDADELLTYSSNPFLADTDGDGSPDGEEVAAGSNILDAGSLPATPTPIPSPTAVPTPLPTAEASPLPSATVELQPASTPSEATSATPQADLDEDGLPTADEVSLYGTNPTVVDSDGDGVGDGDEVSAGTNPLDPARSP